MRPCLQQLCYAMKISFPNSFFMSSRYFILSTISSSYFLNFNKGYNNCLVYTWALNSLVLSTVNSCDSLNSSPFNAKKGKYLFLALQYKYKCFESSWSPCKLSQTTIVKTDDLPSQGFWVRITKSERNCLPLRWPQNQYKSWFLTHSWCSTIILVRTSYLACWPCS